MKYISKVVEIEAIQFDGTVDNIAKLKEFAGDKIRFESDSDLVVEHAFVDANGGTVTAKIGDFIIKGEGEVYPCKPDVFAKKYTNVVTDFKERLVIEQQELENKLDKLDNFLLSEKVSDIDDTQKALLQVQATAMSTYVQCLRERIERLK